jgi:hypothetical protein
MKTALGPCADTSPAGCALRNSARRPDWLAVYMGCCADRRQGHVTCAQRVMAGRCSVSLRQLDEPGDVDGLRLHAADYPQSR